jgi:hypothetical protein
VQFEVAFSVQSNSLSVVLLIVRITIKVINEWFCRVQCILVRLYSPKHELKDKQWFEERCEYTHVHSSSRKGECGSLCRGWSITRNVVQNVLLRCLFEPQTPQYFFFNWRAPQQMLRTHRSLKAYCTTLWWRWLIFFSVFPSNGAPVELNWLGKTEVLGEKYVAVPLCPPQIPHGRTRDRTWASAVIGWRLTAWVMARPNSLILIK